MLSLSIMKNAIPRGGHIHFSEGIHDFPYYTAFVFAIQHLQNQALGSRPPKAAHALYQEGSYALPGSTDCGADAGYAAAANDQLIMGEMGNMFKGQAIHDAHPFRAYMINPV